MLKVWKALLSVSAVGTAVVASGGATPAEAGKSLAVLLVPSAILRRRRAVLCSTMSHPCPMKRASRL